MKEYAFNAPIIQREGMNAGYIEFPYDVEKEFGVKGRVPVTVTFDGVHYRGSLVKMGTPCHIVGITKEIRAKVGKSFGDTVHVVLQHDTEPRVVKVPSEILQALAKYPEARAIFDKLSYSHQKEYVQWIIEAKKPETRARRLGKMMTMLTKDLKL